MKELLVKEGEVAKVGSNLCLIEVVREDDVEVEDGQPGESHSVTKTQTVLSTSEQRESLSLPKERKHHPLDPNAPQTRNVKPSSDVLALPSVRHFANLKGVDLALLAPGSGRNGRVEKKDVEAYLSGPSGRSTTSEGTAEQAQVESDAVVELGRTRYGMWKAMEKVCFTVSAYLRQC